MWNVFKVIKILKKQINKLFINFFELFPIVQVFNPEKFLYLCLKIMTEQSLSNVEIICIDDGSIDNSSKILTEFKKIDNRLKL